MEANVYYSEQYLLNLVAEGDEKAYAYLYKSYYNVVFDLSLKIVKTEAAAQDVCNEVFLNIWQNRQRLPEINCLKAYLLTATRNQSLNLLKIMARSVAAKEEIAKTFPATTLSSEAGLLEKEYVDFIRKSVAQLPARSKQVFILCREEGYSYEDVSAELGISRNAVKNHMVYSMKKLRSLLAKDLGISWLLFLLYSRF